MMFFFVMIRRPPRSTRTDTLVPYTTLVRSPRQPLPVLAVAGGRARPHARPATPHRPRMWSGRSEEHTSELQSLMRISYAVFCLKKKQMPTRSLHKDNTSHSIPTLSRQPNTVRIRTQTLTAYLLDTHLV